ncbi:MAG: hypothetical protein L3J82_04800 [Planctomycetes bacterium]|nr:hypothetical protein [Planctomycetota bacterium]
MDFNEFINKCWERHEAETEAVANELAESLEKIEDAQHAGLYCNTINHVLGIHLHRWADAADLCEKALSTRENEKALANPFGDMAVSQFMAGRHAASLASAAKAMQLTDMEPISMSVRTNVMIVSALVDEKRYDEALPLYSSVLELARSRGDEKLFSDKAVAITSNNLASLLMEQESRTEQENQLMLDAAYAAREFWLKAGNWVNEERAEYLLAMVYNKVSKYDEALGYAGRAVDLIQKNGEEVVDEAFINLSIANSFKGQGNRNGYDTAIERANELMTDFADKPGLVSWFESERTKVEWK